LIIARPIFSVVVAYAGAILFSSAHSGAVAT
jgi:hypothetical protein